MKERITVTLDAGTLNWVDKMIDEKIFANRSHAFEYLIKRRIVEETHGKAHKS